MSATHILHIDDTRHLYVRLTGEVSRQVGDVVLAYYNQSQRLQQQHLQQQQQEQLQEQVITIEDSEDEVIDLTEEDGVEERGDEQEHVGVVECKKDTRKKMKRQDLRKNNDKIRVTRDQSAKIKKRLRLKDIRKRQEILEERRKSKEVVRILKEVDNVPEPLRPISDRYVRFRRIKIGVTFKVVMFYKGTMYFKDVTTNEMYHTSLPNSLIPQNQNCEEFIVNIENGRRLFTWL